MRNASRCYRAYRGTAQTRKVLAAENDGSCASKSRDRNRVESWLANGQNRLRHAPDRRQPFCHPNDGALRGEEWPFWRSRDVEHVGAAIHWSSAAGAYRLDLVRLPSSRIWQDHLGFAQSPDLGFEQFIWDCFAHSSRLTDFLNELRPFIRPSHGAPTPAPAAEWLNAKLVSRGFSLGIPKAQPNRVRVPVVWVFGTTSKDWGSQSAYARVDFVDWTPDQVRLVRRCDGDCWGTGARSLRRYLHQIVDAGCGPLLTEKGAARMEELHRQARTKGRKPAPGPVRLGAEDLQLASDLRSRLRELVHPLSAEVAGKIDRLAPKAYAGILTSCHTRGIEQAACAMLRHRRLPDYGQGKLLERFVSSRWVEAFQLCAAELQRAICSSEYGCSPLMRRALDTGDVDAIRRLWGHYLPLRGMWLRWRSNTPSTGSRRHRTCHVGCPGGATDSRGRHAQMLQALHV